MIPQLLKQVLGYLAANKADYSNADAILNKGQPEKQMYLDYLKNILYDVNYNLNN